jgi:hypothetical protein
MLGSTEMAKRKKAAWLPAMGGQTWTRDLPDNSCPVSSTLCDSAFVDEFMGGLRSPVRSMQPQEHFMSDDLIHHTDGSRQRQGLSSGFMTYTVNLVWATQDK